MQASDETTTGSLGRGSALRPGPGDRLLDGVVETMRRVAAFCLAAMAAVTLADVFGRAMGHPIFGSEEIAAFLGATLIALSLPYAHRQRSHIGVEILMRHLSLPVRVVLGILTKTAATVLFGVVTWRMGVYAMTMRASGTVSMNLQFPEYMVVLITGLGFAVFSLCLARDVLGLLRGSATHGGHGGGDI